jgi:ATP-binding cassette subfamily B protein RaxB
MFFYSVSLAAISIAGLLTSAFLRALFVPANRQLNEESLIHSARQNSSLLESLRAYDSVQLLGIAATRLADWQRHFAAATNARARLGQLLIWSTAGTGVINTFEQVFFLGFGIVGITEKQITLGVLFAFMSLRGRLSAAAMQLSLILQDLFLLQTHTRRLSDIVLASPARPADTRGICRPVDGHLSMRDVRFGYHDGQPVLEMFTCDIRVGEHIAVTGPSGCGKSTLLGLLSGQLRPWQGSVCLDDSELDLWRIETLRDSMAIILQNDALFPGSIAENICGFCDSPDMEAMRRAAMSAAIWSDIRAMPMMHNTRIGDMQGGLSGGQRQRIILARAFYRCPRIILMDEATSHLDRDTERQVLDAIDAMSVTAVSVTHRQDVVQRACRVIRLQQVTVPPVGN